MGLVEKSVTPKGSTRIFYFAANLKHPKNIIGLVVAITIVVFPLIVKQPSSTSKWQTKEEPEAYMRCSRTVGSVWGPSKEQIIEFYDTNDKMRFHSSSQTKGSCREEFVDEKLDEMIGVQVFNLTLPGTDISQNSCISNGSLNHTWSLACLEDYTEKMKNAVDAAGVKAYSMWGPVSDFLETLDTPGHSVNELCTELRKLKCVVLHPPKSYLVDMILKCSSWMYDFGIYLRRNLIYIGLLLYFCL